MSENYGSLYPWFEACLWLCPCVSTPLSFLFISCEYVNAAHLHFCFYVGSHTKYLSGSHCMHIRIMQEWEPCINNSIKNTTRIIQWNPSAITAAICGGLPDPSVDHPQSLLNTQTMLGSITGAAMTQTRCTQAGKDTPAKITSPLDTQKGTGKRNLHKMPC